MLLQWSFCSTFVHFIVKIAIIWSASDFSSRSIFVDWQQGTAQFVVWTSEYPRWEFSIADFKRYIGIKFRTLKLFLQNIFIFVIYFFFCYIATKC